ncbi:MAG: hypothetical protein OXH57_03765 [Ekhidna sp.]|nr:hypothetical protein [Ekhidna sp.]
MKLYNIKFLILYLLILSISTSCLEEQDEEFSIVGAVPTIILLNKSEIPLTVDIGGSFDIDYRFFSPEVVVTKISITDTITSATGTEKNSGEIYSESISDFITDNSYERSLTYTASNAQLEAGDIITITIVLTASNDLSNSLVITTVIPDCPEVIGGSYLATTIGETPFDGAYDNSASPHPVTITDNGDGTYDISDVTGGLYGDLYAKIYTEPGADEGKECDAVTDLPATLVRDGCTIGATDIPDDAGFVCWLGSNPMQASGIIDGKGVITISFSNVAEDNGTTTLVRQ